MSKVNIDIPFPAYDGDGDYIFASYAHADARLVYPELERLKKLGYNVWYDEGVSPGSRWSDELALRIKRCSLFIVMITPNMAKSIHCQDELNYVLESERPLIALHLQETELPPGLHLRLGARQAIFHYKIKSDELDRKLSEAFAKLGLARATSDQIIHQASLDLTPGDSVGNFRLLEVLGEGGMGTVFLAEQKEPIARRVALKVIKLGMDTKEVLARFEAERQALALLSHPNTATVYESGATSSGRPYFAMEYVPGISITQYCDDHKLDFTARVELLKQACKGVLHAHQKGIVHRDLKSSNILVYESTGGPQVKIIDFGIAKSMQSSLSEATLYTRLGDVVGSPGYASPEQMSGNTADVDTRTDVYSLGIVLYELLTGTIPFDDDTFLTRNNAQIHQLLRDYDPPLPITKLHQNGNPDKTAAMRSSSVDKIRKSLKGDLSSIVMKAIQSKRDERYPSVSSLMADLERWLIGAPVEASPQNTWYLLSRFIKRHVVGVTIGTGLFALLLTATVISTYSFMLAKKESERANMAVAEAQTTIDFLLQLFEGSSPDNRPDPSLTARELLDQGAEKLKSDPQLDASVRMQLSETVADVYLRLWLPQSAISLLRDTINISTTELGENHILVHRARVKLGDVLRANGEALEAKQILSEEKAKAPFIKNIREDDIAKVANNLGLALARLGEYESAEPLYLEALAIRKQEKGDNSLSVAVTLHNLGLLYIRTQQLDLAEETIRQSLAIRKRLYSDEHPRVATSLDALSSVMESKGNFAEAETLLRQAMDIRKTVFGTDSRAVSILQYALGGLLIQTGDWKGAREAYEQSMKIDKPGTIDWAFAAYKLAYLEKYQGNYRQAQILAEQALPIIIEKHGKEYRHVAWLNSLLSELLLLQETDIKKAEDYARDAMSIMSSLYGEDHINTAISKLRLSEVFIKQGQSKIALSMAQETLEKARADTSLNKSNLATALFTIGRMHKNTGGIAQACQFFEEHLSIQLRHYSSDHPFVLKAKENIHNC